MKTIILFLFLLITSITSACNDRHFGLALNQRSYYNPAALCPYCKGSTFMSTGMNFIPGVKNNFGMYYAFGNDEGNILHGPWDFSFSTMNTKNVKSNSFSFRYAYCIDMGKWKAAVGTRVSHYSITETYEEVGSTSSQFSTKLFDADAGIMVTNQKGIYIGASILHLGSPQKNSSNELGVTHSINTTQTLNVMGGFVQKISKSWDVLPDFSFLNNKTESVLNTGAMVRYNHHFAAGGSVVVASTSKPSYEIRGGYTSSKFKWITSVSPSSDGIAIETGIVWRFWFTQDCTGGGACTGAPAPWKKVDDFVRHR